MGSAALKFWVATCCKGHYLLEYDTGNMIKDFWLFA